MTMKRTPRKAVGIRRCARLPVVTFNNMIQPSEMNAQTRSDRRCATPTEREGTKALRGCIFLIRIAADVARLQYRTKPKDLQPAGRFRKVGVALANAD